MTEKRNIVIIGASTGGIRIARQILAAIPADLNGSVILVQHASRTLAAALSGILGGVTALKVKTAEHNEDIRAGTVYCAPAGRHLRFIRGNASLSLEDGENENGASPSIDAAMHSLRMPHAGMVVGVILDGVGRDGVEGMRHLHDGGAVTLTLNRASSIVHDMPQAVCAEGLADHMLSPEGIGKKIVELCGVVRVPVPYAAQPCPLAVVGVSTGGPRILKEMLADMPRLDGAIVIVQHMPVFINQMLRASLAEVTGMEVRVAASGDRVRPGVIYLAPSDVHLTLENNSTLVLAPGEKVNFCCPSIDVTMKSVRPNRNFTTVGVVLTGMGKDGAAGLAHMKDMGCTTMAQDEATCVIPNMPRAAVETGKVDFVFPHCDIGRELVELLGKAAQ